MIRYQIPGLEMLMAYQAYVDGSYFDGRVGYGAVLLLDGALIQEFGGAVTQDTEAHQVAGELVATITVLQYCQDNHISSVEIIYDYLGIEKWATGRWKTNTPLTRRYAAFVRSCLVEVRWTKVKSHSGDNWNDRADELAKRGAGSAAGTAKSAAPANTAVLASLGEAFADFLAQHNITAQFDSVKNEQYARLLIYRNHKRAGFFDLYNTKNRPLEPYLHGFGDGNLQAQLERLWKQYKQAL